MVDRFYYAVLVALLVTGCADTQGPVERSRSIGSDWKEFGESTWEDITGTDDGEY